MSEHKVSAPPKIDCRQQCGVDNNHYPNLYVDLTMRCNMDCNFCYNPLREKTDMEIDYFRQVCERLPAAVNFRFLGGEPTMSPDFLRFIKTARRFGHTVFFASNGLNYNNPAFMRELSAVTESYVAGLSMDGGTSSNAYYNILNNSDCLENKLSALENLRKYGIKPVCLSAIITRGVNESVIGELLQLVTDYSDIVRYIHFRSAAMLGRWVNTRPYTQAELYELMKPHFSSRQLEAKCVGEIFCTEEEGGDCCYRFRPTRRLQISLIEFATDKSSCCPKRGKLSLDDFTIQPFFENMMRVGEALAEEYGEVGLGKN